MAAQLREQRLALEERARKEVHQAEIAALEALSEEGSRAAEAEAAKAAVEAAKAEVYDRNSSASRGRRVSKRPWFCAAEHRLARERLQDGVAADARAGEPRGRRPENTASEGGRGLASHSPCAKGRGSRLPAYPQTCCRFRERRHLLHEPPSLTLMPHLRQLFTLEPSSRAGRSSGRR